MPATTKEASRPCRMDVRLTALQRRNYEKAAELKGQTLTQWTLSHLDDCARSDIEAATRTVLEDEDFDAFCKALEEPMPTELQELLSREPMWA